MSGMICCHFFCSAVFSMPVCRYPMVGTAETTTSPSISRTSRNTPWVEGCCGPMLTVIVSRRIGMACSSGSRAQGSGIGSGNLCGLPLAFSRQPLALYPFLNQLADGVNQGAMHFLHPRRRGVGHVDV